jgi:ATPase subunit of ABC transporter with duplicated ATPase domains
LKENLINYVGGVILVTHEHEFYQDWVPEENIIKVNKK